MSKRSILDILFQLPLKGWYSRTFKKWHKPREWKAIVLRWEGEFEDYPDLHKDDALKYATGLWLEHGKGDDPDDE